MARFQSMGKRTFSGRKPYILFLCTGNTCRSPMAQGVLQRMLQEAGISDLDVRTAGVMTIPGLMPTQECRQLLEKDGIDVSAHRSHQLTPELIKQAKLVLGMTSFHIQMAFRMSESAKGKTFLLKEFTGSDPKNGQVQDPMGCTLEVYKRVYREIKAACKRLIKKNMLKELLAGMPIRAPRKVAKPDRTAMTNRKKKRRGKKPQQPEAPRSKKKKSAAKPSAAAQASAPESAAAKPKASKPAAKKEKPVAAKKPARGRPPKKAAAKKAASAQKPAKKTAAKTRKAAAPRKETRKK